MQRKENRKEMILETSWDSMGTEEKKENAEERTERRDNTAV
jgi:hypothetical protein